MQSTLLVSALQKYQVGFHQVVPYDPATERLYPFDFTENNSELGADQVADTESFSSYINARLASHYCKYGIGGYNEHRTLYARSKHFDGALKIGNETGHDDGKEPRRLHLGTDIWGPAGTKVMAPLDGIIHSFAYNNKESDYGATIILTHNLDGISFHTLYGHLSLKSLGNLHEGNRIGWGETVGEFGMRFENGNWPPHLHFQIINEMKEWNGDYPGVCKFSERELWLNNSPHPDLILQLDRYIKR